MLVISDNTKISEDDEREKSKQFKEDLAKYYSEHDGKETFKCPIISGRELDLYKLFQEVRNRGGFQVVSDTKQWKDVVSTLDLPPSCTSASFTVRNHYMKYLLQYEKSIMKTSPQGNVIPTVNSLTLNKSIPTFSNRMYQPLLNQPTPNQEQKYLNKKILRPEPELNFFFRNPLGKMSNIKEKTFAKKIRVLSAILDMKRVELAFESHMTTEVYWAVNTLLFFSSNINVTIHIENQPYLMESMTNYIYYCVNNISELWFIIDIIDGKRVEQQERLKEKWNWKGKKGSVSNPISSAGSSTSLFGKERQRYGQMGNTYSGTATRFRNLLRNSTSQNTNGTQINNIYNTHITSNTLTKGDFKFTDQTSHNLSLSSLAKRDKNLKDIDNNKASIQINDDPLNSNKGDKFEEMTEYELYEILISLIQIIRNLSFTTSNEASIFKSSKFMNILYLLFIHSNYNDIVINALDILINLSKHILLRECPYDSLLMYKLFVCLTNSNRDISELALECLRKLTLPNGNEEYYERMPDEFLKEIVDLLISPKGDVRDSALEILYCLSDQSIPTKTRLGKTEKCIQRLVALICSNSNDNRMSKFAACVLSKLAEIPSILKMIMPYEQELVVAASTDDTITKVILGIISN